MKYLETKPAPPPQWLRIPVKFSIPKEFLFELAEIQEDPFFEKLKLNENTRKVIQLTSLNTVCQEASCPNLNHCWSQGTATFLIMGNKCTRRCGFCDIDTGKPLPLDPEEPKRLALAVQKLHLKHVVITSVDRDDLKDCGSEHFAKCILEVKKYNPHTTIEVLIPDFKAKEEHLIRIWQAKPTIINHNIETVPSLYKYICPQSNYANSLKVLELSSKQGFITKTGLIVGLGETEEELKQVIREAREVGTNILTIGQYLQPTTKHAPLVKYYPIHFFEEIKKYALDLGFLHVESSPNVRSSFHAGVSIKEIIEKFNQISQKK